MVDRFRLTDHPLKLARDMDQFHDSDRHGVLYLPDFSLKEEGTPKKRVKKGFSGNPQKGEGTMSKQLISVAYWIGMASTVLAIIDRGLLMIGVSVFPGVASPAGKVPLSPKSFLEGAVLFFVMAIASYVMWAKTEKS